MPFLLLFSLIIGTQIFFSYQLFTQDSTLFLSIGAAQLSLFLGSLYLMIRYFRTRPKDDYKAGFTAFGVMIASGVPALGFLIPGIIGVLTDNFLLLEIGWALSFLLFLAILFGIGFGRWNWKVHRIELQFENLPLEMDGSTWIQLSDIHVGSFFRNYDKVGKAIEKINGLNADYLLFTGDLVNNSSSEMDGWEALFSGIKVKKQKFSILGNHDYGDYVKWDNDSEKSENLHNLIRKHQAIGWQPLLNQTVKISDGFWLLGVENWGKPPFRQSGKLQETLRQVPHDAFKLLLSHDPSHFDEQVIKTNIDLTLSGHTHGMQFGIERFGIKLSPVAFKYPKWAGLYQVGKQYLYVNRGFGYLGFPGRVGIYPEITHITLKRK